MFLGRWARFTSRSLVAAFCWPWTKNGRRRFRRLAGRVLDGGGFRIAEQDLADVVPEVKEYDFALARALDSHPRAIAVSEVCVLGALLRYFAARRVFEFGTYRGYSTLQMALLAPAATLITLDRAAEIEFDDADGAPRIRVGEMFLGTPEAARIRQVFCDSMAFDPTELLGRVDLVFIDGKHTYPYVRRDSENAFRMLAPRGAIVWHDYTNCTGVERYLDEIASRDELFRPRGTSMVVYLRS